MKKLILLIIIPALLGGCVVTEQVGKQAKNITDRICNMPAPERAALRATVDRATAPHKIRVECNAQGN